MWGRSAAYRFRPRIFSATTTALSCHENDSNYLKSNLSLPAHLIGENPKLVSPLYPGMQTGLFVKDGGNLVRRAETIDGKLMLNNREMILSPQNL